MYETDMRQSMRSIRVGKIINLKNSDFIPNNSNNRKKLIEKKNTFSLEKNIKNIFLNNDETKQENFSKRKISDFKNTKDANFIFNNKTSNNFLHWSRKSNYSKTENNKNAKLMIIEGNENKITYDSDKDKAKNYKNLKLFLSSKTLNPKRNLNKIHNLNNNLFKNFYYIKSPNTLYNEFNQHTMNNTISTKPQLTTESSKSGNNPQEKNYLRNSKFIKMKLKKNLYQPKLISQNNSEYNLDDQISDQKSYKKLMRTRQKYPFVLNEHLLLPKKFIDLPRNIKKNNKKYFNILKNENDKIFTQYFSIVAKEKFSKKFQNIRNLFDFQKDYDDKEKNENKNLILNDEELNENEYKDNLINEKIISGYKLLEELKSKDSKIFKHAKKLTKKQLFYKFEKSFIFLCSKLDNISVYMHEIIYNYQKPTHSYFFPNSRDLFFAIKSKNLKLAEDILNGNKNLVLDFDYFKMTALHFAAKYNFYQIIPKLFEYGTHMDDINYIGDTALLISIKHNFITCTIFLLLYLASPFIKDKMGFNAIHYSKNDFKLNNIMKKICLLHYKSIFGKTKNKMEFIQKEFSEYIIGEYSSDLENDAYNIINEKLEFFKRKNN